MVELTGGNKFSYILRETFPKVIRVVGDEIDDEQFKVFIREDVLFEIDKFLSIDKTKESGGVLVGNAYKTSEDLLFIHITGFIIADHTDASVTRLTFTHKTWEVINEKLEAEFDGKIILGWFHSHPGHSVFMSEYDVFIQNNFFDLEFMTAYVFDPVLNERAFFYSKEKNIIKLKSFYLTGEKKMANNEFEKIVDDQQTVNEFYGPQPQRSGVGIVWNIVVVILLVISLYFGYSSYQKVQELEAKTDRVRVTYLEVDKIKADQNRLSERLENFIMESTMPPPVIDTTITDTMQAPGQ